MPVIDLGSVVGPQGPQGATGATGAQGLQGNPGPNQVTNQTSTNLIGVLQGVAGKVTAKPVDEVPTKDSTNFVTSGGVAATRLPVIGMGRNLLDNWYFVGGGTGRGVFPVNHRGQNTYTSGYTVDRWYSRLSGANIRVESAGLWIRKDTQTTTDLVQILDNQSNIEGKTVTLTVFASAGFFTRTFVFPSTVTVLNNFGTNDFTAVVGGAYGVTIRASTTTGVRVYAVKLELGSEQTLCHNDGTDEEPVWVLNEVPDYEEELLKCMTSTADPNDDYARAGVVLTKTVTETTTSNGRLSTGLNVANALVIGAIANGYFVSVYTNNNVQGVEVRDTNGAVVASTSVTVTLVVLYV